MGMGVEVLSIGREEAKGVVVHDVELRSGQRRG